MSTKEIAVEYRLSHWAQVMQKRMESGLSIRAFCKDASIHENVYYYWQRKLREATCEELAGLQGMATGITRQGFAEVTLSSQGDYRQMSAADPNHVSIEAAGFRVTAGSGYPVEKLVYLLRAVMQSC
jgi:hypothetical protein